jgi:exonuclease I
MGFTKGNGMIYKEDTIFCFCDFETTGLNTLTDLPLEVACIFTDINLNEISRFESLIAYPHIKEPLTKWIPATLVHKLELNVCTQDGLLPFKVAAQIALHANQAKKTPWSRVVLISDNPRFEWGFMQNLFGDLKVEDIFHYSAEGVNLLLHLAAVDKKKADKAHRAMADAEELLECTRLARQILLGAE